MWWSVYFSWKVPLVTLSGRTRPPSCCVRLSGRDGAPGNPAPLRNRQRMGICSTSKPRSAGSVIRIDVEPSVLSSFTVGPAISPTISAR